jgi:glutathione S-transferase
MCPAKYPYLIDPNAGIGLSEPKDIIDYLADIYDALPVTTGGLLRQLDAGQRRLGQSGCVAIGGSQARKSIAPQQPLELFSFESSPYSRLVREVLCELELPYLLRNAGKARWSDMGPPIVRDKLLKAPKDTGRNRKLLYERTGKVQFPYLIDPNTGAGMFESAAIVDYLETRYAR